MSSSFQNIVLFAGGVIFRHCIQCAHESRQRSFHLTIPWSVLVSCKENYCNKFNLLELTISYTFCTSDESGQAYTRIRYVD